MLGASRQRSSGDEEAVTRCPKQLLAPLRSRLPVRGLRLHSSRHWHVLLASSLQVAHDVVDAIEYSVLQVLGGQVGAHDLQVVYVLEARLDILSVMANGEKHALEQPRESRGTGAPRRKFGL